MNDAVGIRGVTRAALAGPTKKRRDDVWAGVACDNSWGIGWMGWLGNLFRYLCYLIMTWFLLRAPWKHAV